MVNGESVKYKAFVLSVMCVSGMIGFYLDKSGALQTVPIEVKRNAEAGGVPGLSSHPFLAATGRGETPPVARLLGLGERAEKLELLMRDNGITDKKAVVCLLAAAKHESEFKARTFSREKDGSISRGVFMFNSRGLGRNTSIEKLYSKEHQVKSLVAMKDFRQWYGETKTKNWSTETAMRELTRRIIRCAKVHYSARIATAKTWWKKLESGGNKGDS